jgi:hypothetical protein
LIGAAALFCVLVAPIAVAGSVGGSEGPEATASSVQKQIKKLKRRVNNLEQQVDRLARQPGPPGQDATKLFGYIRDGAEPANVQYGSGVTAVTDPAGPTSYTVTFNRSLVNCVVQAVAGIGNPMGGGGVLLSSPIVTMDAGTDDKVNATFIDPAGSVTDTSFMITAFC